MRTQNSNNQSAADFNAEVQPAHFDAYNPSPQLKAQRLREFEAAQHQQQAAAFTQAQAAPQLSERAQARAMNPAARQALRHQKGMDANQFSAWLWADDEKQKPSAPSSTPAAMRWAARELGL